MDVYWNLEIILSIYQNDFFVLNSNESEVLHDVIDSASAFHRSGPWWLIALWPNESLISAV